MGIKENPGVIYLGEGAPEAPRNETETLIHDTRREIKNVDSHIQRLLSQAPQKEEICKKSEIKEARVLSEQEILETVIQTCALQGLDLEKLEKIRIIRDEHNNIVVLEVMAPDANKEGNSIEIKYTIRGKHGMNQSPNLTQIEHTNYDENQIPDGGFGEAARFVDGKWSLGVAYKNANGKDIRTVGELSDPVDQFGNRNIILRDPETNEMLEITSIDGKQVVIHKQS